MTTLLIIIVATFAVSAVSFIGALTLGLSKTTLEKILLLLVALAAGGLLGGSFLHIIPESFELVGPQATSASVLIGFCLFLILEQFLHWHHDHHGEHCCECPNHPASKKALSSLIVISDGLHNLIDGLVIASAFVVSVETGIVATIAVALHELPQEIGDYGVLVYSGLKRTRALLYNFISGLTAVVGGIIGFFFATRAELFSEMILPIAAGGFIYLAASDLIPEIKHSKEAHRVILNTVVFIIGIVLMLAMHYLPFEAH